MLPESWLTAIGAWPTLARTPNQSWRRSESDALRGFEHQDLMISPSRNQTNKDPRFREREPCAGPIGQLQAKRFLAARRKSRHCHRRILCTPYRPLVANWCESNKARPAENHRALFVVSRVAAEQHRFTNLKHTLRSRNNQRLRLENSLRTLRGGRDIVCGQFDFAWRCRLSRRRPAWPRNAATRERCSHDLLGGAHYGWANWLRQ